MSKEYDLRVKRNGRDLMLSGKYIFGKIYDARGTCDNDIYWVKDDNNVDQLEYAENFVLMASPEESVEKPTQAPQPTLPAHVSRAEMAKAGFWTHPRECVDVTKELHRSIKKQQKVASMALDIISVLDDNAIVAGGAPRNWDHNMVANDIDLYLYAGEGRQAGQIHKHLKRLFGTVTPIGLTAMEFDDVTAKEHETCPYDCMDIKWVFECKFMGETLQLIFMKQPTFNSVVDKFDCSICKIWFNGHRIIKEPAYRTTEELGVVFVNDPDGKQNRHLEKLLGYFGDDYPFVIGDPRTYRGLGDAGRATFKEYKPSKTKRERNPFSFSDDDF